MEKRKNTIKKGSDLINNMKKENYEMILASIFKWPKWKKDYCNKNLLVSKNSKKI